MLILREKHYEFLEVGTEFIKYVERFLLHEVNKAIREKFKICNTTDAGQENTEKILRLLETLFCPNQEERRQKQK